MPVPDEIVWMPLPNPLREKRDRARTVPNDERGGGTGRRGGGIAETAAMIVLVDDVDIETAMTVRLLEGAVVIEKRTTTNTGATGIDAEKATSIDEIATIFLSIEGPASRIFDELSFFMGFVQAILIRKENPAHVHRSVLISC